MYGVGKLFDTKWGGLAFSLAGGLSYFAVVMSFIMKYTENGGALLGLFFCPAIVCGAALIILKTVNRLRDEELYSRINMLVYLHAVLFVIAAVFFADIMCA